MKLNTTKAIVLKTIKYNDNGLIAHCFTEKSGMVSYLMKGVFKPSKKGIKPSLFQPLSQLEVIANYSHSSSFQYIKEAKLYHIYKSLHTNVTKNAQVFFLSDICYNTLIHEPASDELFLFLQKSFSLLDQLDVSPNFHLKFLLELTEFLGFQPLNTPQQCDCFFLDQGRFGHHSIEHKHVIVGESFYFFKQFLSLEKQECLQLKMTHTQRNELLKNILLYYQWHSPNFKHPNSLEVLQSLFH